MRKICYIIILLFILTAVYQPAETHAGNFEITPTIGYTFGGTLKDEFTGTKIEADDSVSYGFILSYNVSPETQVEFYYSHQPTELKVSSGAIFTGNPLFDLDIDYFHLGGLYGRDMGNFMPFIAAGLGVTHLDPERGDSENKFSVSLGGGLKLMLAERIGLRLEGRGFGTYIDSGSSTVFCTFGSCAIVSDGDFIWQFSTLAGLILTF